MVDMFGGGYVNGRPITNSPPLNMRTVSYNPAAGAAHPGNASGGTDTVNFSYAGFPAAGVPGKDTPQTVNTSALVNNVSTMSLSQAKGAMSDPDGFMKMFGNPPASAFV